MAKPKQQIHVVELALDTTGEDNRRIEGILEAAKRLINTTLLAPLSSSRSFAKRDTRWVAKGRNVESLEQFASKVLCLV